MQENNFPAELTLIVLLLISLIFYILEPIQKVLFFRRKPNVRKHYLQLLNNRGTLLISKQYLLILFKCTLFLFLYKFLIIQINYNLFAKLINDKIKIKLLTSILKQ